MTTLTNSQQDAPVAPPQVYRPERGANATASKFSESFANTDGIQEETEKMASLQRSETMTSVHFLLAHQPSRKKPGYIVERKRECIVQTTNKI